MIYNGENDRYNDDRKGGIGLVENIVIKPFIQKRFDQFLKQGRVFFFSAPCGFGKTAVTDALLSDVRLKKKKIKRLNAGTGDFSIPKLEEKWDMLLIDDLQSIQEDDDWLSLCDLIRNRPEQRFLLLSRGSVPGSLMNFQYVGLMDVIEADDLLFDWNDIKTLFERCGVTATDSEINDILKASIGYPLGVMITARYLSLSGGKAFSQEIVGRAFKEVFAYFDVAVYRRFDLPMRRFLLELAPFEQFDLEMARMVSGNPHAGELLDALLQNTTMLRNDDIRKYYFWPQFRSFLLWEMDREYTAEKKKVLFSRGGLYYELKEDYVRALECYTTGGDHSKVSELLIRNAELHPGMGHYSEMEKYYRSLPESEILASPSLMQGMSMLCALAMDYEESERWYRELQEFSHRCEKKDAAGKQAKSRLAWLDISLPQRGVDGLTKTIPAVFQLLKNKQVKLPPFSVTSALPSLMNGGKDFSEWSKKDDLLYQSMRIPVEAVLGKDGVGLADCAIAESKFEKGENIYGRMLSLIPYMNVIRQKGTPDIEFAVGGLLARSQLANGQSEDAKQTILSMREQFLQRGWNRFLPNMDAMICRIDLHMGNLELAESWYRQKAPKDPLHLNGMKRYQYFTQAMVELSEGKTDAALLTLVALEPYIRNCKRHIDSIHLHILMAIAFYQRKDASWKQHLEEAMEIAQNYRFIRTISVYGTAVLPLLMEQKQEKNSKWHKQCMTAVRTQAAFYPNFLRGRLEINNTLTPMELQILHLICADKSNAQIAQMMNIKLPTVKTHVSHILNKLDVKRRSEAKTVAKKLRLVGENL